MKDAQKPDHVSLQTLLNRMKEGRFVVPDFQREFEWEPSDIRDLMRSIFLDYFIGSLLLWKGKPENFEALSCEPLYGHRDNVTTAAEHIVLDGQQRLTAMYYAFVAPDIPLPKRSNRFLYFIHVDSLMADEHDKAFEYVWFRWGQQLLDDTAQQYDTHMFPLAVVGEGGWALPNWVQGYEQHWSAKQAAAEEAGDTSAAATAGLHVGGAREFGDLLKGVTEQYQVSYIELDRDLELDKVCDIFTQINSRGVRLDVFDLINALLKPKGLQLKHLWREAAPRLEFISGARANVYVLQVMSILRQAYCSPKYLYYLLPGQERTFRDADGSLHQEVLVPDADDFHRRWSNAVDALETAIAQLRHPHEYGVTSPDYLPYVSIVPAFAAIRSRIADLPAERQLQGQRKVRSWYWASVFANRYSGSVESTAARDFLDVVAWFEDDEREPSFVGEFKAGFRNLDLRAEVKRGSSVYNGVFNLLVLNGPQDWMTGTVPQAGELDDHHIVPKAWGKVQETRTSIDSILNRTPLSSATNRNAIRDRLPNQYLPELIDANGSDAVRATLRTHYISDAAFDILLRDPFGPEDYEAFTVERHQSILQAIESLLVKERLDLAPLLQELDTRIEGVELGLRHLIDSRLAGEVQLLPSAVSEAIDQRLATAVRRNPAVADAGALLAGRLELADLRELEVIVANKALWPRFEDVFVVKQQFSHRLDQLAELRNGIRHSRAVTEVVRKDGEAALHWFEPLLPE